MAPLFSFHAAHKQIKKSEPLRNALPHQKKRKGHIQTGGSKGKEDNPALEPLYRCRPDPPPHTAYQKVGGLGGEITSPLEDSADHLLKTPPSHFYPSEG